MIKLIKKCFIKNYTLTSSDEVRFRYGIVAGVFGIISNFLLFIGKLLVGLIGASITIVADAINNLSDMGSNCIVIFGFKLSNKPADSKHPFGEDSAISERIYRSINIPLIDHNGISAACNGDCLWCPHENRVVTSLF